METMTQRRTTAAETGIHKPAGAASSVFDAGRQAKPPAPPPFDPSKVTIKSGVPIPPAKTGRPAFADDILSRMKAGDSVELPTPQARSLMSRAKKTGITVVVRQTTPTTTTVWRQK